LDTRKPREGAQLFFIVAEMGPRVAVVDSGSQWTVPITVWVGALEGFMRRRGFVHAD
jgi:hypothetical protein